MFLPSCWDHIWSIAHTYDRPGTELFCLDLAPKPFVPPIPQASPVLLVFPCHTDMCKMSSNHSCSQLSYFTPSIWVTGFLLQYQIFLFFLLICFQDERCGFFVLFCFFHNGCKNTNVHSNSSEWGGKRDRKPPAWTTLCMFSQERESQSYLKGGPMSDWFICNLKLSST